MCMLAPISSVDHHRWCHRSCYSVIWNLGLVSISRETHFFKMSRRNHVNDAAHVITMHYTHGN
jgi:hypothetical protein